MVLAFAFVTNFSGMSTTLALVLAGTGAAFGGLISLAQAYVSTGMLIH